MRLIDADAFVKGWQDTLDENPDKKGTDAHLVSELFIALLKEEPTIEAEPIRHGRWEKSPHLYGYVRCSVCKNCNVWDEWVDGNKWNYCPNCGAKMDLEGE